MSYVPAIIASQSQYVARQAREKRQAEEEYQKLLEIKRRQCVPTEPHRFKKKSATTASGISQDNSWSVVGVCKKDTALSGVHMYSASSKSQVACYLRETYRKALKTYGLGSRRWPWKYNNFFIFECPHRNPRLMTPQVIKEAAIPHFELAYNPRSGLWTIHKGPEKYNRKLGRQFMAMESMQWLKDCRDIWRCIYGLNQQQLTNYIREKEMEVEWEDLNGCWWKPKTKTREKSLRQLRQEVITEKYGILLNEHNSK
jgi:hypothetical protein